jgi:hypothetical protein
MGGKDVEPWEQPGALRRDYESHRSGLLLGLGLTAGLCGILSVLCLPLFISVSPALANPTLLVRGLELVVLLIVCFPWLMALALGISVWVMADRDLARMRAGLVDPRGLPRAEGAREWARIGLSAGLLSLLMWTVGVVFSFLARMR